MALRSVRTFRPAVLALAALVGATAFATGTRDARADDVSPTGKGIAGGALLGAEVITITESIVGVRAGWAYGIGALVGAGGGAAGGYFVEKGSTDGKAPMYMLAGGLALVIPAIVLTLNATRYMPEEGATEDRAPTGPAAEPGVPGGGVVSPGAPSTGTPAPTTPPVPPPAAPTPAPTPASPAPPPQSLLDVHKGDLRMGVPLPDVLPVYTAVEQRQFGLRTAETEFRMPVLHVVF